MLGAGATAIVVGVLLLGGSTASAAPYPVPPPGAVVLGAEAGPIALGLAVSPGHGKIGLQASVVAKQGPVVKGLSVRFDVHGTSGQTATATGTACGAGCFRTTVGIRRPLDVVVRLTGQKPVTFAMPASWPAPSAAGIVRQAEVAWHKLRTLAFHQVLSDGHASLATNYEEESPNRLEYTNAGNHGAEIIIGSRRWLRFAGTTTWVESAQTVQVRQPVPYWESATDAYLLCTVSQGGRPAWKVSFFDLTGGPAWFTIVVDKATLRTSELWMTAHVHFVHKTYHSFDAPIAIVPPR